MREIKTEWQRITKEDFEEILGIYEKELIHENILGDDYYSMDNFNSLLLKREYFQNKRIEVCYINGGIIKLEI